MPLQWKEPHEIITTRPFGRIYHQRGRFFYPDGSEIYDVELIIKMLQVHSHWRKKAEELAKKHKLTHILRTRW